MYVPNNASRKWYSPADRKIDEKHRAMLRSNYDQSQQEKRNKLLKLGALVNRRKQENRQGLVSRSYSRADMDVRIGRTDPSVLSKYEVPAVRPNVPRTPGFDHGRQAFFGNEMELSWRNTGPAENNSVWQNMREIPAKQIDLRVNLNHVQKEKLQLPLNIRSDFIYEHEQERNRMMWLMGKRRDSLMKFRETRMGNLALEKSIKTKFERTKHKPLVAESGYKTGTKLRRPHTVIGSPTGMSHNFWDKQNKQRRLKTQGSAGGLSAGEQLPRVNSTSGLLQTNTSTQHQIRSNSSTQQQILKSSTLLVDTEAGETRHYLLKGMRTPKDIRRSLANIKSPVGAIINDQMHLTNLNDTIIRSRDSIPLNIGKSEMLLLGRKLQKPKPSNWRRDMHIYGGLNQR